MPAVAELPILTALACLIVALALTVMVIYVVRGFFGVTGSTLGKLPVVGGWIDATGHHIEQRITNALGQVVIKLEAGIGAAWHWQARIVDWLGREIGRHANLLILLASLLSPVAAITSIVRSIGQAQHLIRSLVHRLEGIGHDLNARVGHVERGIGADVLPRIKGLEHEVHGVISRDIPGLRTDERTAQREITNLWKWTRANTLLAGTRPFAAAVAAVLAGFGLSWLRCNSLSRIGKRLGCRGFGLLEDLLFGVIDVLVIADLCRLTGVMINVAESSVVQDALGGIIGGIDDLLRCQGVTRPETLDGYWTDPPPLQAFSVLPGV